MSRSICIIVVLCMISLFLNGCQFMNTESTAPATSAISTTTSIPTTSVEDRPKNPIILRANWPHYNSVDTLVGASDLIFEGIVKDISFAVVNMKTGKVVEGDDGSRSLLLHTIYEIEVKTAYKGSESETVSLAIMGGIVGYNEETQYQIMEACGIYNGIPILNDHEALEIGAECLFLLCDMGGDHLTIPNQAQYVFIYDPNDKGNNPMIPSYASILAYFDDASEE